MNKKVLGIGIPYYKNSEECETLFRNLMQQVDEQLNENVIVYVYEDGQFSNWLWEYAQKRPKQIKVESNAKNKGVSYARNKALDYLKDKVLYMLFLDSDDKISDNYISKLYEYCSDNSHDVIETAFMFKNNLYPFEKDKKRGGVSGSAFKTSILGDLKFDEKLQIGEDTKFMNELLDFSKHRKKYCKEAIYYYQFGKNNNSLTLKYERNEIGKER